MFILEYYLIMFIVCSFDSFMICNVMYFVEVIVRLEVEKGLVNVRKEGILVWLKFSEWGESEEKEEVGGVVGVGVICWLFYLFY